MDDLTLIRCDRCGERVSDTAETCPICGAKIKIKREPKSLLAKTAPWILWLSLVANVVQYTIADSEKEKRQTAEAARVASMSGAQTFAEACNGCHNSRKLNNLRLTKVQWKEALERMANYEHRVPEAKLPGLLDYLVAMTSGAPGPAKP